jgi:peptide deformylase
MALRNLTNWNDPIFRKKSRVVEQYDARLRALLDDMLETLKNVGGYGCAAVHVGILRRAIVVNDENAPRPLSGDTVMAGRINSPL